MHTYVEPPQNFMLANVGLTRLIDPAKGMSGVVFACLEAVFTEVKVVTIFTFKSGAINRKHLAAVTSGESNRVSCKMFSSSKI